MSKNSLILLKSFENPAQEPQSLNLKFGGVFYRFMKKTVWLFTKKYKFKVSKPNGEPNFYVCRHKNMKGVVAVMKSSTFDMHPFILHVFSTYKSAYNHFLSYTFKKRFKLPKIIAVPLSAICSAFMSILFKSIKAIPTYRSSLKAFSTLKFSTKCLLNGESVIVFPDVDYKSTDQIVGEIYDEEEKIGGTVDA